MRSTVPIVRETNWWLVVPQAVIIALAIGVPLALGRGARGVAVAAGVYLAYSFGSRAFLLKHHKQGMVEICKGAFDNAIEAFQLSHDFLSRHPWIDRYRGLVLLSPSAPSYREIALLNIAFSHGQAGRPAQAEALYRRVAEEYPDSAMAKTAVRCLDSLHAGEGGNGAT